MDKENIENQLPVSGLAAASLPRPVEVQSSGSLAPAAGSEAEVGEVSPQPRQPASKLRVTVKSWSGVAVWKWLANDDTCGICRVAFDGEDNELHPSHDLNCKTARVLHFQLKESLFSSFSLQVVVLTASSLVTTARWCGASAPTASTSTASRSGWPRSRPSTSAPCAGRTGSTKNNQIQHI